jgi:hypothetical protein
VFHLKSQTHTHGSCTSFLPLTDSYYNMLVTHVVVLVTVKYVNDRVMTKLVVLHRAALRLT